MKVIIVRCPNCGNVLKVFEDIDKMNVWEVREKIQIATEQKWYCKKCKKYVYANVEMI